MHMTPRYLRGNNMHLNPIQKLSQVTFKVYLLAFFFLASASFSTAQAQQNPVREWTVLVYMNADNDLYRFGFLNMSQMEQVGSTEQVNILVQMDHEEKSIPTTRYYVTKNPKPTQGKITSQVLETLGETNMGDPKTLAEFVSWGIQKYPARHYAVIIWNHGNGWQGVSYDDNPKANLTLPNVRTALQMGQGLLAKQRGRNAQAVKFDIINFDACLMSTLEVAYELKDVGQYLVGSQFNEPGSGEDYSKFLAPLIAAPQKSARELAEVMVYQYALTYQNDSSINYAAVDLNRVQNFTGMLNESSKLMAASPLKGALRESFGSDSFDLITAFTRAQVASGQDQNVQKSLDQFIAAYGYPQDFQQNLARGAKLAGPKVITRTFPGTVYFKASPQAAMSSVELKPSKNNLYVAELPAQTVQYTVQRNIKVGLRGETRTMKESTSSFLRQGNNPIVFHNAFPETSPLIADAYSFSTKGAHGMTLYSLAGLSASKSPQNRTLGRSILTDYKQLQFASQGAPAWTAFFGL